MGIRTNGPNSNILPDLISASKGLLLTRMTTTAMNAMAAPPGGPLLYNNGNDFCESGHHYHKKTMIL